MKNISLISTITFFICFASGCKNNSELNENIATAIISTYLKSNPEYEIARIKIGAVKFRSDKDKAELIKYKFLEEKGLFELTLNNQKKKFLSKDSTYFYSISLTDKSKPYLLKQEEDHATLRAVDYILDEEKPIVLIEGDSRIARVTVSLKKKKNDFSVFLRDKGTVNNFITKTYKLKFKKDSWVLVGD